MAGLSYQPPPPLPAAWGGHAGAMMPAAQAPVEHVAAAPVLTGVQGHETVVIPPQMMVVDVKTQLSATVKNSAGAQSPPYGVLETVTPMSLDSVAIPRGRIFAELWVTDANAMPMQCLWRGYLKTSGDMVAGPSSVPGVQLYPGWRLQANVTQTDQGAPVRVGFHCHIQTDTRVAAMTNGGFVYSEEPGSGRGESIAVQVTNPAAGADFSKVVPACCAWKVRGGQATLTSSAVAGNRLVEIHGAVSASNVLSVVGGFNQGPSAGVAYHLLPGVVASAAALQGHAMMSSWDPEAVFPAGSAIQSGSLNLGMSASDQWSSIFLSVESWAVPA